MNFEKPIVTVDIVLFTLQPFAILLHQRPNPPFAKTWALPGGFVRVDEDEDALGAARRILSQKTGANIPYLEQLFTFSGRARDPRGWSVSIAHYALMPRSDLKIDPEQSKLFALDKLPQLPFDHQNILNLALSRLRSKSTYSSLPSYFLKGSFTISELQVVYEQVLGTELDRTTFRRHMLEQGLIESTEERRREGAHRPAQLYRRKPELVQTQTTIIKEI